MKAVILCGGKGTRMKEETEFRPKPLVYIGGKPILWHIMKIFSHYGVREFVLCLGYKGEMIKDYFLNYQKFSRDFSLDLKSGTVSVDPLARESDIEDWKITFVETGLESETGNRIAAIEPYVKGETFLLTYGDGVANVDISKLVDFHRSKQRALTCTGVRPESVYGIFETTDGAATGFREKPRMESIINGGFFVCEPGMFPYLNREGKCVFEKEPLQQMVRDNQVNIYDHNDFWYCMDTFKHVEDLNSRWNNGQAPWRVWNS